MTDTLDGLTDAQAMAKKHPRTFTAPSHEELTALDAGNLVKICRNDERFWCVVRGVDADGIDAEVNNHLRLNPDLPVGKMVRFERRHVFSIDTSVVDPEQLPDVPQASELARDIAAEIIVGFSKERPEVQMSYDAWMMLRVIIEIEIDAAIDTDDQSDETPTVQ